MKLPLVHRQYLPDLCLEEVEVVEIKEEGMAVHSVLRYISHQRVKFSEMFIIK